jgi:uncharacterized repeat protein (TIGR01451 family)
MPPAHHRYWRLLPVLGSLFITLAGLHAITHASLDPAPILLVVNDAAPSKFGRYLGEILRAEGLNAFDVIDIGAMTPAELAAHRLTVLADTPLNSAQAATLTTYVAGGGRLIAMRPDAQIKSLFGLDTSAGTLSNGYLLISDTAILNGSAPGQGLVTATLQIHGATDRYTTLGSAVTLARLYSTISAATSYPAVVAGSSGRAVAFTYDLARNVAYTRQGNPANADIDVDGDGVTRTIDLFQTVGGGAPWVDRDRIHIPQADEQQRLFARLTLNLIGLDQPLPQLWYFPDDAKTMLILTGDAHANPTGYYTTEIDSINARGGKITLYLSIASDPPDSNVQAWRAQGHEFGIHPYAYAPNPGYPPYDIQNLAQGYAVYSTWFNDKYSSSPSRSVRTHQVEWRGWTDAADIAAVTYTLDTNFYHWGEWLQKPDTSWPHGYITGSGRPMKFVRADGTLVPLYQQLTQLVDEQLVVGAGDAIEGLSSAQAISVSKQLIDASLAGDYAALMTQFHVDYYPYAAQTWAEGTMDYANAKGVPMWNADRWLSFTETRHDANYTNIAWHNASGTLTFTLSASATAGISLTTMLPLAYSGRDLQSVNVDGSPRAYSVQTIKGVDVAFVSVPAGNHTFVALYAAAPPSIVIAKTPDQQTVDAGASVTFTIAVTNTGGAALSNVQVSDPLAPDCDNNIGPLAIDAATSYTCSLPNASASFTNTASVTGTPPAGPNVSDSDSAHVIVNNPTPSIASLDPLATLAGGPTFVLTVDGASFVPGATIYWDNTALTTTLNGSGQVTATVPAGYITAADTISITVVNPAPGGGASNALPFVIQAHKIFLPFIMRSN